MGCCVVGKEEGRREARRGDFGLKGKGRERRRGKERVGLCTKDKKRRKREVV